MATSDERMDKALDELDNWYDNALKNGCGFKTEQDRLDYLASLGDMEKHPMFAQSTEDLEGNPLVEAIRAIKEEGKTFHELALMYKDEGNEWMKKSDKKSLHEALKCYTHALKLITQAYHETVVDLQTVDDLHAIILSNRAQTCLLLHNYGSCKKDCDRSLFFAPKNMKAHYRKCKATYLLKTYEQCIEACDVALAIDPKNQEILSFKQKSQQELERISMKKNSEYAQSWKQLKAQYKQIWEIAHETSCVLSSFSLLNPEPYQLRNVWPTRDETTSPKTINWPILFLYPQHNQMDIIPDANIQTLLIEYVCSMFPEKGEGERIPWDRFEEYYASNLVFYISLQNHTKPIDSLNEWYENCLEYHIAINNGRVELLPFALGDLYDDQPKAIQDKSFYASYIQNPTLSENLKMEELLKLLREREDTYLKNLEKKHDRIDINQRVDFLEIHLGCSLERVIQAIPYAHYLSRSVLTLVAYPKHSRAHSDFLAKNKNCRFVTLNP